MLAEIMLLPHAPHTPQSQYRPEERRDRQRVPQTLEPGDDKRENRERRDGQRGQPAPDGEQPPRGHDDQHVGQQEVAAGELNVRLDGDS